jgi:eight-cysteine-cluster-containing protein
MPFITQGKTNIKYILIVVILAAITGGGILAYQYWWLPKQETQPPEIKLLEKVEDETADWKTYIDDSYKVLYKYPPDWEGKGKSVELGCHPDVGPKTLAKTGFDICGESELGIEDDARELVKNLTLVFRKNIIIDNRPAIKQTVKFQDGTTRIQVLVQHKNVLGKKTTLHLVGLNEDNKYTSAEFENIFDKMLSTFKFIEPTEEFCGWSTDGSCVSDSDCMAGGCSGQVCQSKNEEGVITTCEYKDCYSAEKYGLDCKCTNNKCQWSK